MLSVPQIHQNVNSHKVQESCSCSSATVTSIENQNNSSASEMGFNRLSKATSGKTSAWSNNIWPSTFTFGQ